MVLGGQPPGRVGHRRILIGDASSSQWIDTTDDRGDSLRRVAPVVLMAQLLAGREAVPSGIAVTKCVGVSVSLLAGGGDEHFIPVGPVERTYPWFSAGIGYGSGGSCFLC